MSKYHAMHYNHVAKRIREVVPPHIPSDPPVNQVMYLAARGILGELAVNFAKSFQKDNPEFEPITFLKACTPEGEKDTFEEYWDE